MVPPLQGIDSDGYATILFCLRSWKIKITRTYVGTATLTATADLYLKVCYFSFLLLWCHKLICCLLLFAIGWVVIGFRFRLCRIINYHHTSLLFFSVGWHTILFFYSVSYVKLVLNVIWCMLKRNKLLWTCLICRRVLFKLQSNEIYEYELAT